MSAYKGSSYYKRQRKVILIVALCVLLILLVSAAVFFFTECLVFTSDSWRIVLPWKDYSSLEPHSQPDDGSAPIIEIGDNLQ